MFNYRYFHGFWLSDYFQDSVRVACEKCKRYGTKTTCPPHIESVEYYRQLLPTHHYGIIVTKKYMIDDLKNWKSLGSESSEELRIEMFRLKKLCIEKGYSPIIFGAGSCKVCTQCSIPCRRPTEAIIPIEGTGINVIRLAKDWCDITIRFPVEKYGYFYRVGMVLYND